MLQLPLLEFVAAVDHQALDIGIAPQCFGDERLAAAAGATGQQDAGAGIEGHWFQVSAGWPDWDCCCQSWA